MIEKDLVLELYNNSIDQIRDWNNPLIHHSCARDVENYGAAMENRIFDNRCRTVLDIGCGTGNPLVHIHEYIRKAIEYTGADLNPRFVEICRERWQDYPNFTFEQYDISACDLDENYDAIFVNETFAYFNSAEICKMIDYYTSRANKIFSTSLMLPRQYPAYLLIEQTEILPIVNHVLKNHTNAIINRAVYNDRLRIDILKPDTPITPFPTYPASAVQQKTKRQRKPREQARR